MDSIVASLMARFSFGASFIHHIEQRQNAGVSALETVNTMRRTSVAHTLSAERAARAGAPSKPIQVYQLADDSNMFRAMLVSISSGCVRNEIPRQLRCRGMSREWQIERPTADSFRLAKNGRN